MSNEKKGVDDFTFKHGSEGLGKLIANAKPWRKHARLMELCARLVYVDKTCTTYELCDDGTVRPFPCVREAKEHYANWNYKDEEGKERSCFDEWFRRRRRTVPNEVFQPGQGRFTERGDLNLWNGWGCVPSAGDASPFVVLVNSLFEGAAPEHLRWFVQWLAYPLQHPGAKMMTAVVLQSRTHGLGKSLLARLMARIYGNENSNIVTNVALNRPWNSYMFNKQFVCGEEITGGSGRDVADALKEMITGVTVNVEAKYKDARQVPNIANWLFATNRADAFDVDDDDRRLFIHEIKSQRLHDEAYKTLWKAANGQNEPLMSAIMDYLLKVDLAGFNANGHAPKTNARARMIEASRSQHEQWAIDLRDNTDTALRSGEVQISGSLFTTKRLLGIFEGGKPTRLTEKGLSMALSAAGFEQVANGQPVRLPDGKRLRLWAIRDREQLMKMTGTQIATRYASEYGLPGTRKFRRESGGMTPVTHGTCDV